MLAVPLARRMGLGVVIGIVIGGRFLTRPVFRWIAASRSTEVFMATALLLVIGITLAMEFVQLSPALGTFLAGVVLAESEFRHELEANIEPFKGLLLGLFFISVGASIDFGLVVESPGLVVGLVLLLIAIKFPVLLLLGRIFRLRFADNLMIVVVALSMMVTPLMIIFYERWVRPHFIDCVAPPEDEDMDDEDNPVIIAGYGRFGQIVSRLLNAGGVRTTLLDHDASQIELTARFGNKVFYGDPGRVELLKAAGAEKARLRLPNQGQARKLPNGDLPAGQKALKAATARPWVAFGSTVKSRPDRADCRHEKQELTALGFSSASLALA